MATTILLVRHGQTEWNRIERFRGRYDVDLNLTGVMQAKLTASCISKSWKPVAIYASPLARAMKTAEYIAAECHLKVEPDTGLVDIHYGDWQGLTPDEAKEKWPDLVNTWYHQPEKSSIPHGETLKEVQNRVVAAVSSIVARHPDQQIVLVSHTVVNRVFLLSTLGVGLNRFWNIRQEPCAINLIERQGEDDTICSLNVTCHLEELTRRKIE